MVKKNYLGGQSRYESWRVIEFNEIQVILNFKIYKLLCGNNIPIHYSVVYHTIFLKGQILLLANWKN